MSLWCRLSYLVSGPRRVLKKKKAVLQKETAESLRTELRAIEPDTITLHPGETGQYDHGDDGWMYVCGRERTKKIQSRKKQIIYLLFTKNKVFVCYFYIFS